LEALSQSTCVDQPEKIELSAKEHEILEFCEQGLKFVNSQLNAIYLAGNSIGTIDSA